jgi:hypothetical protein
VAKITRKGQEEMVGFALIIIIVAVILMVFLGFYLSKSNNQSVHSYEAESFVQSAIQSSTECQNYNWGYFSVKDLIFMCQSTAPCNQEESCAVLNSTLSEELSHSWSVGSGGSIKGYSFNITSDNGDIISIQAGNITSNSEGSSQEIPNGNTGVSVDVIFNVYY